MRAESSRARNPDGGEIRVGEVELDSIEQKWARLGQELSAPPFLLPGWFLTWQAAFGKGDLRAVAAWRSEDLVGVAPFVRRRSALIAPTNWHTPLFGTLADGDSVRREMFRYISESLRPRRLSARFVGDPECRLAEDALSDRYRVHLRDLLLSPYVPIEGEWEQYWRSRSKNLRGTVRRCRNRLADLGRVELDVRTGESDLDGLLDEGFRLEHMGWKQQRGTSILAHPDTKRFYTDLARWAGDQGFLRLAFLRIDGRAVAFNYCFELHGVHYLIKLGHDFDLQRYGPGTVLSAEMLERAFRLGMDRYEFLGDADDYKRRWTDQTRRTREIQAFRRSLSAMPSELIQVRGRGIARAIKRGAFARKGGSTASGAQSGGS